MSSDFHIHYVTRTQTNTNVHKEELTGIDMCGTDNDRRWHDMEPVPFTAVMKAEVEEEACKKAAAEMRYDSHSLFAIKVSE